MGRRGPKPAAKGLRLMRGMVPSSRTPAAPSGAPPVMPEGLSPEEQACWRGLLGELASVPGLSALADRGVLELLSRLEPMYRRAAGLVRTEGAAAKVEAGFMLKTGALMRTLYSELGLSPSGRSRVSLTPAPPPSKLDAFLKDRHGA